MTQIWNEAIIPGDIVFEYRDQEPTKPVRHCLRSITCRGKPHTKVVGSRSVVVHEFVSDDTGLSRLHLLLSTRLCSIKPDVVAGLKTQIGRLEVNRFPKF